MNLLSYLFVHSGHQKWADVKEKILISERIVLQTLAFDLQFEHAVKPFTFKFNNVIKGEFSIA